jgi:hypothetical protein
MSVAAWSGDAEDQRRNDRGMPVRRAELEDDSLADSMIHDLPLPLWKGRLAMPEPEGARVM